MPRVQSSAAQVAEQVFRRNGGMLKTQQAVGLGIHLRTLYAMRDAGIIQPLSRGVYRLVDLPPIGQPDLVRVALRVPNGVICLISALSFHGLTTQVPHAVHLALQRGSEPPRLEYPPVKVYWFTGPAFSDGIEQHRVDGVPLRIYSPEKTIADCFKYRNKLGLDIALEALKRYRERSTVNVAALLRSAQACRVEKVMRPYLEALL
jgi:predicted transcriptional regulator of viral defense system